MRHLFTSGEAMFKKNEKLLPEGTLLGAFLEYREVEPDTLFICTGTLNRKKVRVRFTLTEDEYAWVKNRHSLGILMQSDILQANWKSYETEEAEQD